MAAAAINVNMTVIMKIYLYAVACVSWQTSSVARIPPQCGRESRPQDDTEMIRCKAFNCACVVSCDVQLPTSASELRAMLIPPEAEPVTPARIVTERAAERNGFMFRPVTMATREA